MSLSWMSVSCHRHSEYPEGITQYMLLWQWVTNTHTNTHTCTHSHLNHGRLELLVAEHLDHLHYINDIFSLNVESLNEVLIDHLLNRLLIPLYVYSLTDQNMMPEGVGCEHSTNQIRALSDGSIFFPAGGKPSHQ